MPRTAVTRPFDGGPRGQVLVLFALVLVVLLLVSALAVDYGGWLVARRNYQNVADAASLAGAQQLTRPLSTSCSGSSKNFCARVAAWESVKSALNLTGLDPTAQAAVTPFSAPYVSTNGYSVWVASPPSDAGSAYLGHVGGPGNVYVRVQHAQNSYFSRIASIGATVTSWATAGQFPASFAVIGLCRPAGGDHCLAEDSNIKIDGNNSILIVETGDLGTNAWTKTNGNSSAIALGQDSNAYMEEFNTCWAKAGGQCQLVGYSGGAANYSDQRAAVPLGAPIRDPAYPAPPIGNTTTPSQCRGIASGGLAMVPNVGGPDLALDDLPIRLAAAVAPAPAEPVLLGAVKGSGTITWHGTGVGGLLVELMNGAAVAKNANTNASGAYGMNGVSNGTYTIRVTDTSAAVVYHQTTSASFAVNGNDFVQDLAVLKNPVVSGAVTAGGNPVSGATITITGPGGPFTTTTNASGQYSQILTTFGTSGAYDVTASKAGYVTSNPVTVNPTLDTTTTVNFTLTPAPASLTVNVTDQITGLPIPGVTATLTGSNSGNGATGTNGTFTFSSVNPGSTTITLSGAAIAGYVNASPSVLTNPSTVNINAGSNSANFALWPKGCATGNSAKGDWSCGYPSGNNCPATTNLNSSNVTCTFTQANAIRPGTYDDIDIDGCAWLDPRGGPTGLAAGQSAGIYHIRGQIRMSNDSYLFGDGVTLVFDQGANLDVQNGGGFVLNYGTVYNSGTGVCDLSTPKRFGDGNTPCFRTVPTNDGQDYAYAAWTTAGKSPWQSDIGSGCVQTSPLAYNTTDAVTRCVALGNDLGITFYMYGNGFGNQSRFKIATASMGYLFNGVLYAPHDDVQLGGGKNGQTAAGQIVGWTIEYHGGTRILQNWYGDPQDGPPFLIEPILGE